MMLLLDTLNVKSVNQKQKSIDILKAKIVILTKKKYL
jgi:hypothetical protein